MNRQFEPRKGRLLIYGQVNSLLVCDGAGLVAPETEMAAVAVGAFADPAFPPFSSRLCRTPASLVVGQPVEGEVLSELPIAEVASAEIALPIAMRLNLVNKDGPLLAAVS